MGNYDPFTKYARKATSRRRVSGKRDPSRGGPEVEPRFVCPGCGDRFFHPGACPRCEVESYDVTQVVPVPSDVSSIRAAKRGSTALAVLMPALSGVGAFIYMTISGGQPDPAILLGVIGVGVAGFLGSVLTSGYRTAKRNRLMKEDAEARLKVADGVELRPINELGKGENVRFRGTVSLDPDGKPQVHVLDESGQIRVRIDERLAAYDDEGNDVAFLKNGEEVEVVGQIVPGEGPYRGEKELARDGVTMFVKRVNK